MYIRYVCSWNFHTMFSYFIAFFWPNLNPIALSDGKLWIIKVRKLDVCGRPLFVNLVTYIYYLTAEKKWLLRINCGPHCISVKFLPQNHLCWGLWDNVHIIFSFIVTVTLKFLPLQELLTGYYSIHTVYSYMVSW